MDNLYRYRAKLKRAIDGDTLELIIDLGFGVTFKEKVRLVGIDTPETYGVLKTSEEYRQGMAAKAYVIECLEGKNFIIETIKDKKGKYGRYLATIIIDGVNLNLDLVKKDLAKVYGT